MPSFQDHEAFFLADPTHTIWSDEGVATLRSIRATMQSLVDEAMLAAGNSSIPQKHPPDVVAQTRDDIELLDHALAVRDKYPDGHPAANAAG